MDAVISESCATFWSLVRTVDIPALGSDPRPGVTPLSALGRALDELCLRLGVSDEVAPRLKATALLYHDHHDEAHDLVQDMQDADGALIHAILHRREPDYWNAKYWFRRAEGHPAYRALTKAAVKLAATATDRRELEALTLSGTVDPLAFVDACESVAGEPADSSRVRFLCRLQHAEFEALVVHLLTGSGD